MSEPTGRHALAFTSTRERRLWLLASVALATIYATLGAVPAIAAALRDRNMLDNTFFALCAVLLAAVVAVGVSRRPRPLELAVWIAVLAVVAMGLLRFGTPEERTHLVEYGLVAVLVHLALLERRANGARVRWPAGLAFVVTALFGILDECIQFLLPGRVFDVRDIGFNVLAAMGAVTSVAALREARHRATDHRRNP